MKKNGTSDDLKQLLCQTMATIVRGWGRQEAGARVLEEEDETIALPITGTVETADVPSPLMISASPGRLFFSFSDSGIAVAEGADVGHSLA